MSKPQYILGINSTYHELSACLLKDGNVVAAVEEERFSRIKHSKKALIDNPDVLPTASIEYCLQHENITFHDIEKIGLSFEPQKRLKNISIDKYFQENDFGSEKGERLFYEKSMNIPHLLSEYAQLDVSSKIERVSHHLSHASSAYYVSPFDNAAVLSIDGIGEFASTLFGIGKGSSLEIMKTISYPNSIGFLWERFSKFLGFGEYGASKVMGLAAYGKGKKYFPHFRKLVKLTAGGEFIVDNDILQFRLDNFSELESLFKLKKITPTNPLTEDYAEVAASLQRITDEVFLHIAKYLAEKTNAKNLCLAGGVALNCVANYAIMKNGYFDNMYVQPAANDAGTALGAAFYLYNQVRTTKNRFVMDHAYWGPDYSDEEIEKILIDENVRYEKIENIELKTASLLAAGNIIGWFQGRMEWGPRALGNRSLLADPRNPHMSEILNLKIKKREPFRPFAPSVLEEYAHEWFDIPTSCSSMSTDFMEFAFPVKGEKQKVIPAVTHVDGTSRIQTVSKATNRRYYTLISEFNSITGVPLVLNTSFNENEPIVCQPSEAIKTFQRTRMDYLVLNNFLVKR